MVLAGDPGNILAARRAAARDRRNGLLGAVVVSLLIWWAIFEALF